MIKIAHGINIVEGLRGIDIAIGLNCSWNLHREKIAHEICIVEGLRGIHIAIGLNCSRNSYRRKIAHGICIVEKVLTEFASWKAFTEFTSR